jgi:ribonuclease P/MRP protein subunit POP5
MRQKRRYIAFGVSGAKFSKGEVTRAITNSLRGLQDLDTNAMRMIFFEAGSGRGLLRCERKQVAQVKAAILKLKRIGSRNVAFSILGVSGTIRAAKRKFLPVL